MAGKVLEGEGGVIFSALAAPDSVRSDGGVVWALRSLDAEEKVKWGSDGDENLSGGCSHLTTHILLHVN